MNMNMAAKLRILLADDHETVREGLRMILNAQPDMQVVATAGDGREALSQAERMTPDIVIMDEATAALDVASQDSMMELFGDELEHATLVSVGHRVELEEYHDRRLTLHRHATRVEMAGDESIQGSRLSRVLRRSLRPRPSPDPSKPVAG